MLVFAAEKLAEHSGLLYLSLLATEPAVASDEYYNRQHSKQIQHPETAKVHRTGNKGGS